MWNYFKSCNKCSQKPHAAHGLRNKYHWLNGSKSKVCKALWNCLCGSWQHCCVCCFPHSPTPSKCAHTEIGCLVLAWQSFVMELPLSITMKCEVRAVIQFLNAKGNTPTEIDHQLTEVYGETCMDIKNIRKWCREFPFGRWKTNREIINLQRDCREGCVNHA